MSDSVYNSRIEKIATQMIQDNISPDEQDVKKLEKYKEFTKSEFSLDEKTSMKLVYEALLYLKLKNSESADPLQQGDQFGAGFS